MSTNTNFESVDYVDVLNQLSDAVYLTDTNRIIKFWNKQAELITGWSRSEVIGKACRDNILAHIDTKGRSLCNSEFCPLLRAITTKQPSDEPIKLYALTKSGKRICVSVSVAPLLNFDKEVIGGIEVFRDESVTIRQNTIAANIQQSIVNINKFSDSRLEFGVVQEAKDEVSGDFCNIYKINKDKFGMVVSGVILLTFIVVLIALFFRR